MRGENRVRRSGKTKIILKNLERVSSTSLADSGKKGLKKRIGSVGSGIHFSDAYSFMFSPGSILVLFYKIFMR